MAKWVGFPSGTCHIYLLAHHSGNGLVAPVKVGVTTSLKTRLATLQTGNPQPIELVASFATPGHEFAEWFERCFHDINAEKRLTGEWFDIDPKDALVSLIVYIGQGLRLKMPDLSSDELEVMRDKAGVNQAIAILNEWPEDKTTLQ